jgi:hypothetical protein
MKNETSKNILLDKYSYTNYFLVIAFIILNIAIGREYRDIISIVFILIMLPIAFFKIKNELKIDKEKSTKSAQITLIKMLLLFGIMAAIYFVIASQTVD